MSDELFSSLQGVAVDVVISDPWDAVNLLGGGPFIARIELCDSERMIVTLDMPLTIGGADWPMLMATPRRVADSLSILAERGRMVFCNFAGITRAMCADMVRGGLKPVRSDLMLLGGVSRR